MVWTRSRALITLCIVTGALFVGLALAMNEPAYVRAEAVLGESPERVTVDPGLSLQSSYPYTVYLPLVLKGYPTPPPVFGVQMGVITDSHGLQQAIDGGVHWIRFNDAFHWDTIEPAHTNPRTYHWGVVDESSLRTATANGMQVVAAVKFTPYWAQKYSGSYCGPIAQQYLDEFAEFLTDLVNRYKVYPYRVKYWELGNEPDAPVWYSRSVYGCWGEPGDAYYGGQYYGEMLKVAYPAIKAADPEAQVLIGGLLLDRPDGGTDSHPRFLEGILEAGGGPYFDIVSYHAYTYYSGAQGRMTNPNWPGSVTVIPEKTAFLRGVLNLYGYGDKVLMNTEAALLCDEDPPSIQCLETQSMYIPRAYAEALALGLEGQIYYAMINEAWRHTGLLYPGTLTPKPVYYAYHAAAGFLSDAEYVEPVTIYPSGIEGYTFHQRGHSEYVDVIWSANGSSIFVSLPSGATVYARDGSSLGSPGSISVNYEPMYVTRP